MSEEEKKAIEYWRYHMSLLHWNTQLASEHYIKVLLDLVEKLQKENEKLTEARNWYFEHTVNKAVTPEMLHKILRQDYIPKSVIIKEIEKLKRDEERIREKKKSSYDCDRSKSRMQAYLTKTKEFKERLKELLGGKND